MAVRGEKSPWTKGAWEDLDMVRGSGTGRRSSVGEAGTDLDRADHPSTNDDLRLIDSFIVLNEDGGLSLEFVSAWMGTISSGDVEVMGKRSFPSSEARTSEGGGMGIWPTEELVE